MFYRDEGDAGGGTVNAGAESTETSGTDATVNLGGEGDNTSKGGEGTDKGTTQELTIEQQLEKSKTDFATLTSEHDNLKVKLGEQSDKVGIFNKLTKAMHDNPHGVAAQLTKNAGPDPNKSGEDDMAKLFNSEATPEEQQALLTKVQDNTMAHVLNQVKPVLDQIQEHNLSVKYSDWDERAESRNSVSVMRTTNQMTDAEVNHLVSKGMDVPSAMKAAEEAGVKTYVEGLQKKNDGQITGSGTSDSGGTGESVQRIENFIEELAKN